MLGEIESRIAGLSLVLCSAVGCTALREPLSNLTEPLGGIARGVTAPLSLGQSGLTEPELRTELARFVSRFSATLGAITDGLGDQTPRSARRELLVMRIQVVPLAQRHVLSPDPQSAYVALLSLTVRLRQYLGGDGGDAQDGLDLGSERERATAALRELESGLIDLGGRFLDREVLDALHQELIAFAREHPIRGGLMLEQWETPLDDVDGGSGVLARITDLPMAPFRALEGVNQGASAIHEFSQTATAFASIVSTLPPQLRWQMELLLFDLEERLPGTLAEVFESAEPSLAQVNRSLVEAQALMPPLRQTAHAVAEAGDAWRDALDRNGSESSGGPEGAREQRLPREREQRLGMWGESADKVGDAAERVQAAANALERLVESRAALRTLLDDASLVLERAQTRAENAVDRALMGAALVGAGLLTLGLLYTLLARRHGRS